MASHLGSSSHQARLPKGAALFGAAVLLLSACGGTSAPTSTAASSSAPASSAASNPAASSAAPSLASVSGSPSASASAAAASALTGSPIKIGVLADVTGGGSIEGAEQRINTDLAIEQINATGGINGHPVQATYVDPKGDASEAIQLATQLTQQDKVDVLVGGVYSAECLGVQKLINQVGIVYMPLNACANEELTAKNCSKFVFRTYPVGGQTLRPSVGYLVKTYGKSWAFLAPQNPFGDSQAQATEAALRGVGGELPLKIQIPVGEANVTPYVTKIPTDGSISGIFNATNGTDLARVVAVLQQFGISKKLPQVMALGRESFSGVYPAGVNGAILDKLHLSEPESSNTFDRAYQKAFSAMAAKDSSVAGVLGGPAKATAGDLGYEAYTTMMALKLAMRQAGFTGRADTAKLITALENLNVPQASAEFPAGGMVMNKADHQGRMPLFMLKVDGQKEDILQRIPINQVPQIGSCQIKG